MNMLNTIIQKWVHTNMIKEITSVNNTYIKELLSLRDKQVRNNNNLFIVEGYHLVEEALKHHVLKVALCTDKEVLEQLNVDEKYLDETGRFDMEACDLLAYSHGEYYSLGKRLGKFGFSVEKRKNK